MSCRIETVGAVSWRFCPDGLRSPGMRLRALVRARMIDEITGRPVPVTGVLTPDPGLAPHLTARHSGDGLVGLSGEPGLVFPDLGSNPAQVPMQVAAAGFLTLDLPATLGPILGFPNAFAPFDHGDVPMHRVGVSFKGRVSVRGTPANTPLPNAQVALGGVWSTYPPPGTSPALLMEPPRLCGLSPGLYAGHATATLERCTLVPDLARSKSLLAPAVPGDRRLRLSDRRTLVAGMPLQIDPQDPDRQELIGIATVDTSLSDDQPAWVGLDHTPKYLHRPGVAVLPTAIPATQDPRSMARPAQAGDPVAFLTAAPPWPAQAVLRIDDGVGVPEYQRAAPYATQADLDAYFRLPRLSRVALFQLVVTHASQAQPLLLTLEPDYDRAEQVIEAAFE